MLKFVIIFFTVLACRFTFATEQIADRIYIKGKSYAICSYNFAMQDYLKKHNRKIENTESLTSALWRGYVGEYEIRDNKLFFIGAFVPDMESGILKKAKVIPVGEFTKNDADKALFCAWVNWENPVELSSTSVIWFKGLLEAQNFSISVKNGKVSLICKEMPYLDTSFEDLKRREGTAYNKDCDNLDAWYDLTMLETFASQQKKIPSCNFITREEVLEIINSKTIKTRGIFYVCDGGKYFRLVRPVTRQHQSTSIYIKKGKKNLDNISSFDGKFVEIEITNPFQKTIKLLSIRELSKSESIHNLKILNRKAQDWNAKQALQKSIEDIL